MSQGDEWFIWAEKEIAHISALLEAVQTDAEGDPLYDRTEALRKQIIARPAVSVVGLGVKLRCYAYYEDWLDEKPEEFPAYQLYRSMLADIEVLS